MHYNEDLFKSIRGIQPKKTRALALVFWLLMGDILSPRDEIFFFLFDPLDIVLVTKNDQGC